MKTQYAPRPDGLSGNDDLGQMSAWYVFTALGFYPVAPASNQYIIGRPFLPRATLNLPNGKRFTVIADGLGRRAPVHRQRHPQRPAAAARLPAPRGNHGRRRTALRHAGPAEPGLGRRGGAAAVLDVTALRA